MSRDARIRGPRPAGRGLRPALRAPAGGGRRRLAQQPVYPLEASGTSGMKAGMNGVINLSVLDGWWGEGYDGSNGWAIKPDTQTDDPFRRDREEARTLYEVLQEHVVPLYYARPHGGMPGDWIAMAKRSMASILPRFNADRMLREYVQTIYAPGARQGRIYRQHNAAAAARDRRVEGARARGVAGRDDPARRCAAAANQLRRCGDARGRGQPERPRAARRRRRAAAAARAGGAVAARAAARVRRRSGARTRTASTMCCACVPTCAGASTTRYACIRPTRCSRIRSRWA